MRAACVGVSADCWYASLCVARKTVWWPGASVYLYNYLKLLIEYWLPWKEIENTQKTNKIPNINVLSIMTYRLKKITFDLFLIWYHNIYLSRPSVIVSVVCFWLVDCSFLPFLHNSCVLAFNIIFINIATVCVFSVDVRNVSSLWTSTTHRYEIIALS